jgi:hypothetical protein
VHTSSQLGAREWGRTVIERERYGIECSIRPPRTVRTHPSQGYPRHTLAVLDESVIVGRELERVSSRGAPFGGIIA